MSEPEEELDLLIDDYLDGRMDPAQRADFERRMNTEPDLRGKVLSATRSVQLVQQALGWVTPGDDFDDKVNSKIISITNSGQNLKPVAPTSQSAILERDEAQRERRRLLLIAIIAAALFGLAVCAAVYAITHAAR